MQKEILMYSAHPDITPGDLKNLSGFKKSIGIEDLQNVQDIFQQNNIKAFTMGSEDYHYKFHSIPAKPYIIHYMGDISLLDKNILGIVGPRKPTNYSNKVLRKLFEHAQNYDLATISGMADGVDQMAHALSVKYKIPTIAVLGGGLNFYLKGPQRHIIESIVEHGGLVISEYKINFKPAKYSFPQRNRLIAGLCDVLFLPEAGEKSGSLITADFANKISRPVYVTPNDIFLSTSVGVNQLLASELAKPILDFEGFLSQNFKKSGVKKTATTQVQNLPPEQDQIINLLSKSGELSLSTLVQKTKLDTDTLMQHITLLEMNNHIYQNVPGSYRVC
ncbi:MAG TPA: DNA-processing protein DprA [Candidatus Absconditabacterales bacterium]|nr:DNA-processing protein DprA [Candidatus Absconditabacterales bacterium]